MLNHHLLHRIDRAETRALARAPMQRPRIGVLCVVLHIPMMEDLVAMWFATTDSGSFAQKAIFTSAVAYVVSPVDAIPDCLPGGFVDDTAAVATATGQYHNGRASAACQSIFLQKSQSPSAQRVP